jgi:hypothetical protein
MAMYSMPAGLNYLGDAKLLRRFGAHWLETLAPPPSVQITFIHQRGR